MATQITDNNNFSKLLDELARFSPAEIVVNERLYETEQEISKIKERFQSYITREEETYFQEDYTQLVQKYHILDEKGEKVVSGIEDQMKIVKETYNDSFGEQEPNNKLPYHYTPGGGNPNNDKGATDFLGIIKENQVRKN